jgi:alkylated DNA repair dioxygenase AlkB
MYEAAMLQGSLFGALDPAPDAAFAGAVRTWLDDASWVELVPAWLAGADEVFATLSDQLPWQQRRVTMYDRLLDEPRLTWWWRAADGEPEPLPVLADVRALLSRRYGRAFDSIGFNLYRDGRDSVAWHGDRHRLHVADPVVCILSVGAARPLRLRPRAGDRRTSCVYELGGGDLFVMGGACQHDWEHAVPKQRHVAGPRLSITFRHDADPLGTGVAAARRQPK